MFYTFLTKKTPFLLKTYNTPYTITDNHKSRKFNSLEGLNIRKFKGIYTSLLTPFNEQLEVDLDTLKSQIKFVIDNGINGIVTGGVNGEFSSMTMKERKSIIKTSIATVKNKIPVIAGAYSNSYKESIELINYSEEIGATAAIITRPFFFRKPTEEGLYDYFSKIFDEIKKYPIFLCNVPTYTPMELSIDLISHLTMKYKNIAGIKDLSNSTDVILAYSGSFEELSVLVGSDRMVYNGLNAGCDGAVSAIANILPDYLLKIFDTYKSGNADQAWIEQESLIGIRSLMTRFPSRAAQKFIFSRISGKESYVRPPLRNLTNEEREALLIILSEHGLTFGPELLV
ncbi:MAG: dihydrodipicolinate synthase family protein [Asgard group archaeon]|nr:dihydrodipicolinate synthase family protein [Asgard group archaeon]